MRTLVCFILIPMLLSACSTSRYHMARDTLPEKAALYRSKIQSLPPVQAVSEPLSPRGNADQYEVWGKTYYVDKYIKDYSAEGIASWYGQKFHGYETSNGEVFDVYQFSAAHKSLPLPSFVQVTNLENGKSLIVRVNDRGPFHDDRLIDLSYAAAVRLGFDKRGTAKVKVDLVAPPLLPEDYQHLQVAALSKKDRALDLQSHLSALLKEPVYIDADEQKGLHKVRIGPIAPHRLASVQEVLHKNALFNGIILD
ncbi:septal ring lytic transglycosylase RlpA family protein [Bermanella marisrubri]|uniref:Endolytic peptidoglycan transglycosylase RlpA n=1 Tax=Bermanella marisrubri TaxID=207949 RepID=Q1N083_9GAMM|nr:septal ring lytic transglycosylase RlpA family protein [Bermanella marisrubri]EAT11634.1 Lipoprotein [Oceanobacter sp. RED65] [Bermanella marisrubri]